ncbi:hypothetical protein PR048_021603 [Dryococelus australis]|uniref:Transmembrane protein 17 n=1 Tax=Dryococelus australis TaxID=614101 RepID=A0ABQ9GYQ0_9NEOP|nr:hypothetical protein PR048_021603 [Dryococelus australis]
MSLYFNVFFFPFWFITLIAILQVKYDCLSSMYHFITVSVIVAVVIIECLRLYLGYLGNLAEQVKHTKLLHHCMIILISQLRLIQNYGAGMKGRGKHEIPERTHQPMTSSGMIPTCKSPVIRPGFEPGSSWWEVSMLIAQPLWSHEDTCVVHRVEQNGKVTSVHGASPSPNPPSRQQHAFWLCGGGGGKEWRRNVLGIGVKHFHMYVAGRAPRSSAAWPDAAACCFSSALDLRGWAAVGCHKITLAGDGQPTAIVTGPVDFATAALYWENMLIDQVPELAGFWMLSLLLQLPLQLFLTLNKHTAPQVVEVAMQLVMLALLTVQLVSGFVALRQSDNAHAHFKTM